MCEIVSQAKKNITYYKNYVVRTIFVILINVSFNTPSIFAQEWVKIKPVFRSQYEPKNMYKCSFINKDTGWFIENYSKYSVVWKTNDGGKTWDGQKNNEGSFFSHICFVDRLHGWVLGYKPSYQLFNSYLLITINGGNQWHQLETPDIAAITFLDTLNGFAGGRNVIYNTTDGGTTWLPTQVDTTVKFYIENFYFVDENYGWASGTNLDVTDTGILLNTTDGGKTWHIQIERTNWIHGIYFIDRLNGAIVGDNLKGAGRIQTTHDGGKNWTRRHILGPSLYDVEFTDHSHGWAVGNYGYIFKTEDSGDTWEKVESGTEEDLRDICFVENGTVGYIFGFNKTLLKYSSKVSNGDGSSNVSLSPNYPNPFINKTTFTYDLWEDDQIEISVFDITGRLVDKLFSGYQEKGIYPVTWHPKNISSGIYFFQIKTTNSSKIEICLCIK